MWVAEDLEVTEAGNREKEHQLPVAREQLA